MEKEKIANKNNNSSGIFKQFAVYIGLKDKIEYLVFSYELSIKIMIIVSTLKGHKSQINILKYISNDNKEDYLISCEKNGLIDIWDIQDSYIENNYEITDTLILFNIFNQNYILISIYKNKFNKLFEFSDNTKFIRNI